jgi:hypothetical protein
MAAICFAPAASGAHVRVGQILSCVAVDRVSGNSMTYNALDESSRVSTSAYGGVTPYWLGEGSTKTASKPAFRQVGKSDRALLCDR